MRPLARVQAEGIHREELKRLQQRSYGWQLNAEAAEWPYLRWKGKVSVHLG